MKFKCLIVDDEPLARKLIASHVAKIDGLTVAGECGSAVEAINFLQKDRVDLIFLDIQMPEVDGLQLIRTLKNPPSIILTTAHREFAIDAIELDVMDYLLKPVTFERLLKAINKFFNKHSEQIQTATDANRKFIYMKAERKMLKVYLDEILYLESLDDYVKVHFQDRIVVTRENITSLQQSLPQDHFVRVHRSFIVSISKIDSITAEFVEIHRKQIPFGRTYKQSAMKSLGL